MLLTAKQKGGLLEVLVGYTMEKFGDDSWAKECVVRIYYKIIIQSLCDLYDDDLDNQKSAMAYFKSPLYAYHCQSLLIKEDVMNFIVENPHKYLRKIGGIVQED